MYLHIHDGKARPYSLSQLRADNPLVGFPKNPPDTLLSDYGVYPYTRTSRPSYDPLTQICNDAADFFEEGGKWFLGYEVVNKELGAAANSVRQTRNSVLWETDIRVVRCLEKGLPVPDEWLSYRENLRNLPQQIGFPFAVVWPTAPYESDGS
jgi:hypothetical protein